jgi:hypothetical protein
MHFSINKIISWMDFNTVQRISCGAYLTATTFGSVVRFAASSTICVTVPPMFLIAASCSAEAVLSAIAATAAGALGKTLLSWTNGVSFSSS